MRPMTEESANLLLPQVNGWKLEKECEVLKLSRSWKVKSFVKGLEFFRRVGDVADAEGHHSDLHLVGWNNVAIDIWTHSVENDFILAAKINGLDLGELLRRKAKCVDARLEQD
ncbi:hypothetical protein MLD38_036591 [Melastoma candidum]|uniref:Uncharacterized protein n=1 Tax=Melastoma candidum TaxID=119954 RepID=A0ACB9LK02_9MYRT|nr:hypothetical protein MLD38_036591 [Melastoma candidum]